MFNIRRGVFCIWWDKGRQTQPYMDKTEIKAVSPVETTISINSTQYATITHLSKTK